MRRATPRRQVSRRLAAKHALHFARSIEPIEIEHPLNAALDQCEALIANIVALGGEAPLRARLARLLPAAQIHDREVSP